MFSVVLSAGIWFISPVLIWTSLKRILKDWKEAKSKKPRCDISRAADDTWQVECKINKSKDAAWASIAPYITLKSYDVRAIKEHKKALAQKQKGPTKLFSDWENLQLNFDANLNSDVDAMNLDILKNSRRINSLENSLEEW